MQERYPEILAEILFIQAALLAMHQLQSAAALWGREQGLWGWITPQKW